MTPEAEKKAKRAIWGLRIFCLASALLMAGAIVRQLKSGYITSEYDGRPAVYRTEHPVMFWTVIAGSSPMIAMSLYFGVRGFGLNRK